MGRKSRSNTASRPPAVSGNESTCSWMTRPSVANSPSAGATAAKPPWSRPFRLAPVPACCLRFLGRDHGVPDLGTHVHERSAAELDRHGDRCHRQCVRETQRDDQPDRPCPRVAPPVIVRGTGLPVPRRPQSSPASHSGARRESQTVIAALVVDTASQPVKSVKKPIILELPMRVFPSFRHRDREPGGGRG